MFSVHDPAKVCHKACWNLQFHVSIANGVSNAEDSSCWNQRSPQRKCKIKGVSGWKRAICFFDKFALEKPEELSISESCTVQGGEGELLCAVSVEQCAGPCSCLPPAALQGFLWLLQIGHDSAAGWQLWQLCRLTAVRRRGEILCLCLQAGDPPV